MRYTLGDVEKAVGVHISVIQKWESEVSIVHPKRDKEGRMVYSDHDIRILRRLKHLLYDRHLPLKEVQRRLFMEFSAEKQGPYAQIALIRQELLEVYEIVKNMGKHSDVSSTLG
ncbi:MAG: MerR family transcriptional regulator [Treponema sp.]|jgi:DNA-binding transcriptional MerR regulator|nr:MerR family transcriptional regulator [Treponema sp.]